MSASSSCLNVSCFLCSAWTVVLSLPRSSCLMEFSLSWDRHKDKHIMYKCALCYTHMYVTEHNTQVQKHTYTNIIYSTHTLIQYTLSITDLDTSQHLSSITVELVNFISASQTFTPCRDLVMSSIPACNVIGLSNVCKHVCNTPMYEIVKL